MLIIKKDGVIYLCESKCNCFSFSSQEDFLNYKENLHIIQAKNHPKSFIVAATDMRYADIIRYEDIFPRSLTPQNLINKAYPALLSCLEPYGYIKNGKQWHDVAFAKKDKCYVIRYNGAIDELEEFWPFCHEKDAAIGLYLKHRDEPIYQLIKNIYSGVEAVSEVIQFPVVVMNTKNAEVKVITRGGDV